MTSTDQNLSDRQRELAARLGQLGFVLPGTITERMMRCGKPRCACTDDNTARHGPYIQWTRTVDRKTVTKILTRDQLQRYQPWFDNHHQLRDLAAELETLSLHAISTTEGWGS